ncbi:hypothetical protein G6F31_020993 [Rhizopus arrhizus]|nr:hypothetical protein G6F31_020993 [Rhizopus arrhizus]
MDRRAGAADRADLWPLRRPARRPRRVVAHPAFRTYAGRRPPVCARHVRRQRVDHHCAGSRVRLPGHAARLPGQHQGVHRRRRGNGQPVVAPVD